MRQGDATTVRDFRRHAGLDLLPRLLLRAGELDLSVVRSILETRLHNGPKIAELAAQRRSPELAAICSTTPSAALEAEDDPVERQRHALAFWDHVVDGADSIAFRLMYNTLRATYEPALPALAAMMAAEVGRPEAYRELADTIAAAIRPRRSGPHANFSNPPPRHARRHRPTWRDNRDHSPPNAPRARNSRSPMPAASSGNTRRRG